MTVWAVLFGSLNVGGNRVTMERLREAFQPFSETPVKAVLASGNLIIRANETDRERLQSRLTTHIVEQLGFKSYAVARTQQEIEHMISANPFASGSASAKLVHSFALEKVLDNAGWSTLMADHAGIERIAPGLRDIYVDFVDGVASTKLTLPFLTKRLGCRATGRNMSSLAKISEAMQEVGR
jgi:uncharacterized protein (DUF1697 family)